MMGAVRSEPVKVTGQRVARRIKELRLERSLTLADLATRLAELDRSYTLSTLSRIEQGKRRVDTDDLIALALALDVPPNTILFPPNEQYEARTKLTANIEADTMAVLRWAASGDTAGLRGQTEQGVAPIPAKPVIPVHRSILAVDLHQHTRHSDAVQVELRRILYDLLGRALQAVGIGPKHLERFADRGDGMLILIRSHDDVPKEVLLSQLMPMLAALLAEHNAAVTKPELRLRLRAVVHAGEIYDDGKGVFGEDLDVAFRLLDSPAVKRALNEASAAPLVMVVSEEIYSGVVRHGYVDMTTYRPLVRVRVGHQQRRGWIHVPAGQELDRD